jgi:Xaa-Pro aminopeptidase
MTEFETKQDRVRALLARHGLDALLLQRVSSFAWVTCGAASYVNTATTTGAASLLITPERRYVLVDNIEAPRLDQEEGLKAQGWDFQVGPWHEPSAAADRLARGLKLGSDWPFPGAVDLSNEMARCRASLLPEEQERFRHLGQICARAMDAAIRAVRPGQSEQQMAAILAYETQSRGAQPIVNLIATDERIYKFRHPLPADKTLQRYAMLILCGRRHGLVVSVTRLVHFGPLPAEVRRKMEATARVDAAFIAATRPGATLGQVFQRGVEAYGAAGFADEWRLHHQGGPAGYEPREYLGLPGSTDVVSAGQAYAWNPSITGTKSEDSMLVGESGNEVVTVIEGWPMLTVPAAAGQTMERPAILEAA